MSPQRANVPDNNAQQFDAGSFVSAFNSLSPYIQHAIWGDALPAVKSFIDTASTIPADSPVWSNAGEKFQAGGMQHDVADLARGAALIAGAVLMHNPEVMNQAASLLKPSLPDATNAPVIGAPVETPAQPTAPEAVPAGATIGEQLTARQRAAQQQQWKELKAAEQQKPGLPFHPGAGIPKPRPTRDTSP
jgi:hypothetical protein